MSSKLSQTKASQAVFYREFLRRAHAMGKGFTFKEALEIMQCARKELGLQPYKDGSASGMLQTLTKGYSLNKRISKNFKNPPFTKNSNEELEPSDKNWGKNWHLFFAPRHSMVRWLECTGKLVPITQEGISYHRFIPMYPVFPEVDIVVSKRENAQKTLLKYEKTRQSAEFKHGVPGLYFKFNNNTSIYIGKTDEPHIRSMAKRPPFDWIVFVSRAHEEGLMSLDVLNTSEALLITFWSEITRISNNQKGVDKAPVQRSRIREASSFVAVVSAALLQIHSRSVSPSLPFAIPFKKGIGEVYFLDPNLCDKLLPIPACLKP